METCSATKSGFYQAITGIKATNLEQENSSQVIDEKPFVNFSDIFNNIESINYLNSSISYIDGRIINSFPSSNESNMPEELKTAEFWNKRRQGMTLPELLKEFESKASL